MSTPRESNPTAGLPPRGWHYERVVAHRGGGIIAPENTLAGMRAARDHGLRAVEFDVMLASDGVPILMHDPKLGRTLPGTGNIADIPSTVLQTMDAGSWRDPNHYKGEPVPLFADVVRWLRANDMWANIEIKPYPGKEVETGEVVGRMAAELYADETRPLALPVISSFSIDALAAAQRMAPGLPRGLLLNKIPPNWAELLERLDCIALHTSHVNLTPEIAAQVKKAGYGLFCYTVNEPARGREILSWGVDSFCTDRIDLFARDFS